MRVIGVVSSPNVDGNNSVLAREALKGAKEAGADVDEVFLASHQIQFCKGCMKCMSEGKCVIRDDFTGLKNLLSKADGIILCSPTYAGSINAMMKSFLERFGLMERFTSGVFGGKYIAGISTCSSGGADETAGSLTKMAYGGIFQRGFISGKLAVKIQGRQVKDNPAALKKAYDLGRKIALDIQNQKHYTLQNMINRAVTNLFMKPIMSQAIIRLKDGPMKAVHQNLLEKGLI
jgi:multimeric flavodoxin WrbA